MNIHEFMLNRLVLEKSQEKKEIKKEQNPILEFLDNQFQDSRFYSPILIGETLAYLLQINFDNITNFLNSKYLDKSEVLKNWNNYLVSKPITENNLQQFFNQPSPFSKLLELHFALNQELPERVVRYCTTCIEAIKFKTIRFIGFIQMLMNYQQSSEIKELDINIANNGMVCGEDIKRLIFVITNNIGLIDFYLEKGKSSKESETFFKALNISCFSIPSNLQIFPRNFSELNESFDKKCLELGCMTLSQNQKEKLIESLKERPNYDSRGKFFNQKIDS